jgi:adenosine kinase
LPPKSTAYIGCVGADELAEQLRKANDKEGLHSAYQVLPKGADSTGACAVVITGHDRQARLSSAILFGLTLLLDSSLCTKLGAAEKFSPAHLESPEVKPLVEAAQFYYLGGFFLTHGVQSALSLAKQAAKADKV